MMNGLVESTGMDYSWINLCIGVGALVYGFAQPFLGMLALRRSNAFVMLVGILCLALTPMCRTPFTMLLFFGRLLPFGLDFLFALLQFHFTMCHQRISQPYP